MSSSTPSMPKEVIIVLGAAVKAGGVSSNALRRRVAHAIDLWKNGVAPWLLMTGGLGKHPPAEAEVMKTLALTLGVPENAILIEPLGVSTWDSARKCAAIMQKFGWRNAVIVTDSFHIKRSVMAFRRFGINADGDGVAYNRHTMSFGRYLFYVVRDWVAILWYGSGFQK